MGDLVEKEPILIRYDGLDADEHQIDILDFADSLRGIGRIIGVVANFSSSGRYVQHRDAMAVRVVVQAPEAHCFEIAAWVKWVAEEPLLSGTGAGLLVALITYVFKRAAGKREEMRLLKDSLDKAIQTLGTRDRDIIDRMLTTIDKMADSLKPAARQAVTPLGHTARTLSIGKPSGEDRLVLDTSDRDAIQADSPHDIGKEQSFEIIINELDLQSGSCRFMFANEPENRLPAQILDPQLSVPNNPYALALASTKPLQVRAKASFRDGLIEKLYVSDA